MSEENVKVAVRVRPFNSREKEASAKLCIEMSGNKTICTDPKSKEEKKFAYDFSYWSFDGFKTDSTGYFQPDGPKYADQKKVYSDLGSGVLTNAWSGYNASLFAYGQTGSGKSYSVVGYGPNKGIVPLVCEDIFKKAPTIKDKTIEVTFSMLEIYSEVVRDLLNSNADRKQGLIIREDPKIGFYPTGLTKTLVSGYDQIVKLTDQGTANRTIASTNMNATSSRAHTIVTVNLVQKYKNDAGKEMALSSLINLVDLAGSERADQTGATGDRLKEGAAINLSLTSLGNVISALAENSSGKNVRVPYRDSVLTKLLMNALGGNSKTIMIAAISPADINFDESVSTLRYADRAKQIKCKATVNEDPTEKLIKDLKEENARLKKMLESGKIDPALLDQIKGSGGAAAGDPKNDEAMKKMLDDNEKAMQAMQKSYEEKLADAKKQGPSERDIILEKAKKMQHFTNVNMDPSLSKTIKLILEGDGKKVIAPPGKGDIPLNGVAIQDPHAYITVAGGKCTIEAVGSAKILRNGRQVTGPVDMVHLDRFLFGTSQYYLFIDPTKATPKDIDYTFEMMQDEIAKVAGIARTSTQNWSPEEIKAQQEFLDLLPHVNEVNEISIEMDRKLKYSVLSVPADICGSYDSKPRPYVSVKNFEKGLEWIWDKNKFMDRKVDMTEYYLDFKDDGIINRDKFKNYDPFFESPDTPTQVGTAIVSLKSVVFLIPNKNEFKILDLRSREAGTIEVEVLACDLNGNIYDPNSPKMAMIRNPEKELFDQNISFILKINAAKISNPVYQDVYCEFQMYSDSLNSTPTKKLPPKAVVGNAAAGVGAKNGPPGKPGHPAQPGKPGQPHPNQKLDNKPAHPNDDKKPPHPVDDKKPPHLNDEKKPTPPPAPAPAPDPVPAPGLGPNHSSTNPTPAAPVQEKPVETIFIPFKTDTIKGTSTPNFKYSQQFYYTVNQQFLDFVENKSIHIKVFSQQKPNPNQVVSSLSTKEYFEKKHEDAVNSISGKMPFKLIDPEIQRLRDELNFYKQKELLAQKKIDQAFYFIEANENIDNDEFYQFIGGALTSIVHTTASNQSSSSTCNIL